MDMNRLRYFCTVADTGSLRSAAELLHLSPAALSKSIKLLESELDLELLAPAGRGIIITDAGRRLAQRGRHILNEMDALEVSLRQGDSQPPVLKIGSFEVFTTYFLGPLMKDYLDEVPVVLHEFVPGLLEQALEQREIDLGVTYIPIPSAALDHVPAGKLRMGLYGLQSKFSNKPFDELPFAIPVSPITGSPNKVRGLDGWPDDQQRRWVKYRVTLMESALELCRQGLAVGYLPSFVVELHNRTLNPKYRLTSLALPSKMKNTSQDVYVVKRKSDLEGREMRKIAQAIRMICQ